MPSLKQPIGRTSTSRSAGLRILAARAQRNISVGLLFPQTQQAVAGYSRTQTSANAANPLQQEIFSGQTFGNRVFNDWAGGLNLSWKIDFWGRFRRGIEAPTADLDASVENYDDALVLLISEVANAYVQIRVFQKQLECSPATLPFKGSSPSKPKTGLKVERDV